jgi:hypothetical protein
MNKKLSRQTHPTMMIHLLRPHLQSGKAENQTMPSDKSDSPDTQSIQTLTTAPFAQSVPKLRVH